MSATDKHTASKQGEEFNGTISALGQDLHDLAKITGTITNNAVKMVKENASEYYDKGAKQVGLFEKSIEHRIQAHPLQSLMVVAGVAVVLGALWNRH